MTKEKMKRYCNQWWPYYKLDDGEVWPENGSVNYNTILQLMLFCHRTGKWDEVPYVDAFMTLHREPDASRVCKLTAGSVIYAATGKKESGCRGCGERKSAGEEEQEDVQLLVPAAPPPYRDDTEQPPGASGSPSGNENVSPVSSRTGGHAQRAVPAASRQAVGPGGRSVFVHVPFTTSDLLNLKQSVGSYRENPEKMHHLLETIMLTHNPNWGDVQTLFNTFFTLEEKRMVVEKAREEGGKRNNRQDDSETFLPTKKDPEWDPNVGGDRAQLKQYQQLILYGVRHGVPKPKNVSKLYEVRQGSKENPSAFYERLCEVARKWTDWNPDDEANQRMFNTLFIWQSAQDIRKKLQKVDGAGGMSISQLIEIAYKVYNNRDEKERKEKQNRIKLQASLLAALHIPPEAAWKAQICLLTDRTSRESENIPRTVLDAVIPLVWASKKPGRAKNISPIKMELKEGAKPVRVHQYPIRVEAHKGLEPLINTFIPYGLLKECRSEYNTLILPAKKPHSQEYQLVPDLRAINQIAKDTHPTVSNPYTLLASVPKSNAYFTVLDLKDAFFCIPVDEQSQTLFASEWENPVTGRKGQLCWTVLPQGFKNSPALFSEVLAKELEQWQNDKDGVTLLQYVDDILIGANTEQACTEATISLLNFLELARYGVLKKKAQIAREEVCYLGYDISKGQWALWGERKEAIFQIAVPKTKKLLRGFLGMAGFCQIWIPNFGLIAKPLYAATKGPGELLQWTPECQKSFDEIKKKLIEAPALGLPDFTKPFQLYKHEKQQVASGVMTQTLGSWKRPVAYFSKQLDEVSKGWPACLRAVATIALLIQEAWKLTLGKPITVLVPHAVVAILNQKGHHWISPNRLAKYQATLIDQEDVTLSVVSTLNPATLLPMAEQEPLRQDCLATL
nr:PREDICTED: uncharacterized protein LOC104146587 [Struthio camelus australis]